MAEHFPASIHVRGQVSGFTVSKMGHWYFSLKDEQALLSCVMFKNANLRVHPAPKEGDMVVLSGKAAFYESQGRFQIVAREIRGEGIGDLHARFEKLKQKLHAEGLFDAERKKTLPPIILRLCVITSKSGAALHDLNQVLDRRMPCMRVSLIHAQVQGKGAVREIVAALAKANQLNRFDAVLITRGGGSAEDLSCFNEEDLVRAIAASDLPVVSAVGHEIDLTLCDLAADKRSPTPSAAAEELSIDSAAVIHDLHSDSRRMHNELLERLEEQMQRNDEMQRRLLFANPVRAFAERLRRAQKDLIGGLRILLSDKREDLFRLAECLHRSGADTKLAELRYKLRDAKSLLRERMCNRMQKVEVELKTQKEALRTVNPTRVLERGYALALDSLGRTVKNAFDTKPGDILQLRLARGGLDTQVRRVYAPSTPSRGTAGERDNEKEQGRGQDRKEEGALLGDRDVPPSDEEKPPRSGTVPGLFDEE